MTKVKVIELVGVKLDPKASYVFVINEQVTRRVDVADMINHNLDLFENSAFLSCVGEPVQVVEDDIVALIADQQRQLLDRVLEHSKGQAVGYPCVPVQVINDIRDGLSHD